MAGTRSRNRLSVSSPGYEAGIGRTSKSSDVHPLLRNPGGFERHDAAIVLAGVTRLDGHGR
ncbi:hypothetical protein [Paraburkholderia sp.]|uniref:hypothetical protein n=1 Tax=Paraburkholderia sp. TaxID=1926495 RepID=UPI0025E76A75|nr:hypothetical protein [Paraburkholderia sp.]